MNLHYELFQGLVDYKRLFYKNTLSSYMKEISEKCKDSENSTICLEKQRNAYDFAFDVLSSQLHREQKLDTKYEKMANFKSMRGDDDAKYVPFKY